MRDSSARFARIFNFQFQIFKQLSILKCFNFETDFLLTMNIIVLGPQGSGKGTQAEMLATKYNLEHIDMGKSLREVAKQDTPLGREIYRIQNVTHTLVPSDILRKVLDIKLPAMFREQGVLIEGAPRTSDQREYVEE